MEKNDCPNQCVAVLTHLQSGQPLTPLDALTKYGIMRLGARIYNLRAAGHAIQRRMVLTKKGARVAEYFLPTATPAMKGGR